MSEAGIKLTGLQKITDDEYKKVSFKYVASRPSAQSRYGNAGMTAEQFKAVVDAPSEFLKEKVNALIGTLSDLDALGTVLTVGDTEYSISDLIKAITSGTMADLLVISLAAGNKTLSAFAEEALQSALTVVQNTGESTTDVMSQKAVTDAVNGAKTDVVQETGQSATAVMSQKAVTDALANVGSDIDVVQTTGESTIAVMSQKAVTDAVDGAKTDVMQETGQSTTAVMSQKAVTDALANAGSGVDVVQTTGESTTSVMSQDAVTKAINAAKVTVTQETTGESTTDVMCQKATITAIKNEIKTALDAIPVYEGEVVKVE